MNLGSSLDDLNHLTFDPGGAEPMLTCSWTYPVLACLLDSFAAGVARGKQNRENEGGLGGSLEAWKESARRVSTGSGLANQCSTLVGSL